MQVADMRTVSALRAGSPTPEAAARLSDRALRAAAQNPDHSEAGRATAAEVLSARGLSAEPWRAAVRSFLKPRDVARGDALFFGVGARLRSAFKIVALLGAVGFFALLAAQVLGAQGLGGEPLLAALAAATACAGVAWLLLSVFQQRPARVTVIRSARGGGALGRFISRELRCYGHVLTLTPGASAGAVRSAAAYRTVASRLGHRTLLNARALLSDREAMAVSADDAWRPFVLGLLARSSDALIVDVSDGASWAWADIAREGVVGRCVFVASWSRLEEAEANLHEGARCFAYAPDGEVQRRGAFRVAMAAAMRSAHELPA
jgi:hypothetical protein